MRRHPLLTVFTVALAARVVIALVAYAIFGGSPVLDDETYSTLAKDVVMGGTHTWDEFLRGLYNRTATLLVPLTWIYGIIGPHDLLGRLFLAVIGAGTAAVCTRVALELLPLRGALFAGAIVGLLPSQVLWSSLILKDGPVWFLLVALAFVVALAGRAGGRRLLLCGIGAVTVLLLLAYLRQHTLIVACWAFGLAGWVGGRRLRLARGAGAAVIAIALPWALGLGPAGYGLISDNARSIEHFRTLNAAGASAFIEPDADAPEPDPQAPAKRAPEALSEIAEEVGVKPEEVAAAEEAITSSPDEQGATATENPPTARKRLVEEVAARTNLSVKKARNVVTRLYAEPPQPAEPAAPPDEGFLEPNLRHLPAGLSVMLFEPTPWRESTSPSVSLAKLEMVLWYPILLLAALGVPSLLRNARVGLFPLLAGTGSMLTYALTEGNVGTAYRHRGEFVWAVALAAAAGVHHLYRRRAVTPRDVETDPS